MTILIQSAKIAKYNEAVDFISTHMRKSDEDECMRLAGMCPRDALLYSMAHSEDVEVWMCEPTGQWMGVSGIGQGDNKREGVPWLLCTDHVLEHPVSAMKLARKQLGQWKERYHTLYNMMDASNDLARGFCESLGFTFGEPEAWAPANHAAPPSWVRRFSWEAGQCAP